MNNYDEWNEYKKLANFSDRREVFFRERDIWWCSIGLNIGDEEQGKGDYYSRPVLILKKFSRNLFWGIPLTSSIKEGVFYEKIIMKDGKIITALITHMRLFDARRLNSKIERISSEGFEKVKQNIRLLI